MQSVTRWSYRWVNKPLGTVGIYIAPGIKETPSTWQKHPQREMLIALRHCHGQHLTSRTRSDKDDLCPCPDPCVCVPRTHVCLFLEEGCLCQYLHADLAPYCWICCPAEEREAGSPKSPFTTVDSSALPMPSSSRSWVLTFMFFNGSPSLQAWEDKTKLAWGLCHPQHQCKPEDHVCGSSSTQNYVVRCRDSGRCEDRQHLKALRC